MIGIEAAFLMGGLIVTETVFNIPGVARFLVEAIRWRDYPIVQNLVMFIAVVAVSINFLVDLLYAVLDPRIKYVGDHRRSHARMASIDIAPAPRRTPPALTACGRRSAITPPRIRSASSAPRSWWCSCSPRSLPISSPSIDPITTNSAIALVPPSARALARRRLTWAATSIAASSMARASRSPSGSARRFSAACFGVVLGLASGYLGGWVDLVIQRIVDVLQAVPLLVLALVMAAALGPALDNTIVAIAIPLIPYTARVIRSNTLALREQPFVEAATRRRHERIPHRACAMCCPTRWRR